MIGSLSSIVSFGQQNEKVGQSRKCITYYERSEEQSSKQVERSHSQENQSISDVQKQTPFQYSSQYRFQDQNEEEINLLNQFLQNLYVYRRHSLSDQQLDLFYLEEKQGLLYKKNGIFTENAKINDTVWRPRNNPKT